MPQATPTGGPVRDERSEHAISYGLPRVHTLAMTEVGRSMVEMLGVLAIMGIVGMVGVRMYTSAMNKHRANELIYEAQKRATMVAMQITAGQENLSVANFPNPTGYTFGVEKNPLNSNQFNITITGVDSKVCEHMKTAVGSATPIRVISASCDTVTFNNDLSTTSYASDYNLDKDACNANGFESCAYGDNGVGRNCLQSGQNCCVHVEYDNQCQTCNSPNGAVSNRSNTTPCDFDGDGVNDSLCNTGVCVNPNVTAGATCTSNADCGGAGSGYYCAITYTEANNLNGTSYDNINKSCYQNLIGTCTLMPRPTRLTASQEALLKRAGFPTTTVIGPKINWWSANNWCLTQGKHLMDVSEMDCHRKTDNVATNNAVVQAGGQYAYCCQDGQSCQQSSWDDLWDGKNILDGKAGEVAKFADKMVALRKAFGKTHFWTSSPYWNTSENSCNVFLVYLNFGYVYSRGRGDNFYALCE